MDNFRISRLEVNNIGPFGHMVVDFPEKPADMDHCAEIHILTGENGTGKTTVLEMLTSGIIPFINNPWRRIRSNHDKSCDFKVDFYANGTRKSWIDENRNQKHGRNPSYLEEHFTNSFNGGPFGIGFFAYSGYRRIEQTRIKGISELENQPFSDSLNFQTSINPQLILQWVANTITKEALAKNQNDHALALKFRSTISNLEKVISEIIEKPVRFRLEYEPLNVIIEVAGETLDFNLLPDGLKSIVSWIADLLMRMDRVKWENDTPVFERNFILFLDEIEVHLHPAWQRKVLPAVQKLFPNAQIFISTHSPFVVGSVDGAWIHKFVKPNGDSQLAGPPILSEDAKSYRYWLEEVFDIKTEFGEAIKQQLDKFYALRNSLLVNGTAQEREEFIRIAAGLSSQSREMESIISLELRQLNKRIKEPLEI